jgi:exosome complex RNA-binding protein Rrp4
MNVKSEGEANVHLRRRKCGRLRGGVLAKRVCGVRAGNVKRLGSAAQSRGMNTGVEQEEDGWVVVRCRAEREAYKLLS